MQTMLSSTNTALSDDGPLSTPENEEQRPDHKSGEMEDGDLPNIPNPFCFPRRRLFDGLTYNGVPVQRIPVGFDHVERIKRIRKLAMRDDDIIIAAYRKCGRSKRLPLNLNLLATEKCGRSSGASKFELTCCGKKS